MKSSQCFQSTRDVMRHSSALGGGTGDTSTDYRGQPGPLRRAGGGLEGLRGCPCPGDGCGQDRHPGQNRGSSQGGDGILESRVCGTDWTEKCSWRTSAQRGKRAREQSLEEDGEGQVRAQSRAGGTPGECGCGGQWGGRLRTVGPELKRPWGTGCQDWTESENPQQTEQHQSLALVNEAFETFSGTSAKHW